MTELAETKRTPVIVVHGGAWAIPQELTSRTLSGLEKAVKKGHDILMSHGTALDAVEEAIKVFEDDPVFSAGRGSVLNAVGDVEMDAAVMTDDGRPQAGAVASVRCIKNPIILARRVYESDHVLLVGNGAERYGKETGVETAETDDLITESAKEEWLRFNKSEDVVEEVFGHDTVGAVAMDENGRLACGTSTGGVPRKRAGRVGDSAIVGAGLYVDNGKGAASSTGHGESILLYGLARNVVEGLDAGVGESCRIGVELMKKKTGGRGGIICIDKYGDIGLMFSTKRMAWACIKRDGVLKCGIDPEDGYGC